MAYLNESVMTDHPEIMPRLQQFGTQCEQLSQRATISPAFIARAEKKSVEMQAKQLEALKQQEAEVKAKNLQTTGHVSRETVMAFFNKNDEVLASEEVSQLSERTF